MLVMFFVIVHNVVIMLIWFIRLGIEISIWSLGESPFLRKCFDTVQGQNLLLIFVIDFVLVVGILLCMYPAVSRGRI